MPTDHYVQTYETMLKNRFFNIYRICQKILCLDGTTRQKPGDGWFKPKCRESSQDIYGNAKLDNVEKELRRSYNKLSRS